MSNVLEKIIKDKILSLDLIKRQNSIDSLENKIKELKLFLNFVLSRE